MSKRVAFAHIDLVYDFDSKEEGEQYIKENSRKGWWFRDNEGHHVDAPYWNGDAWSIHVRKPYGNHSW